MAPTFPLKNNFVIPTDLLDDIASRFLLDAPESEIGDPIYLCFLTELAYWFYLDEYVEEDDSLNNLKYESFAQQLLTHVGFKPRLGSIDDMLQEFRDFKHRVPTYGGLLLNQDLSQVLLVQGFWHRASWSFPKGKINVDEEPHKCAIREVLEETGYDISQQIDPNVYLENTIGEQFVRLYIIPGVPNATEFVPRTKGEIKQLKWFPVSQLPSHKNDRNFNKSSGSTNMFYMVMPFVKPLREWLAGRQRGGGGAGGREGRRRHRSFTSSDHHHGQPRHSPPSTTDDPKRPTDTSRKQQGNNFAASIQEEVIGIEKLRSHTDSSPRRRDNSGKSKGRKGALNEPQDENQKFSFKPRKGRGGKGNRESQAGGGAGEGQAAPTSTKPQFRSYSWTNFHINKKEVMEAIDRVWGGVTLTR